MGIVESVRIKVFMSTFGLVSFCVLLPSYSIFPGSRVVQHILVFRSDQFEAFVGGSESSLLARVSLTIMLPLIVERSSPPCNLSEAGITDDWSKRILILVLTLNDQELA